MSCQFDIRLWKGFRSEVASESCDKITHRVFKSQGLVILSQLHFYNCERGMVNLVWPRSPPTLPQIADGWDEWPQAWGSVCLSVCEPTGLVFIWRLCHEGGEDWALVWQSKENTQGQWNTHKHKRALLTPPHHHHHQLINFILQSSLRTIRIPWRNDFPIKGDLEEEDFSFFFLSSTPGVLYSNNLNWNWFFNLPADCYGHGARGQKELCSWNICHYAALCVNLHRPPK